MGELEPWSSRELIHLANIRGTLSADSARSLKRPEIAHQIDKALEDSYDVESAEELLLVTLMPDDSGSMNGSKQNSVIDGHNWLLSKMASSGSSKNIMLQTRYLNGQVLNPFSPLSDCQELSFENYQCNLGTPLFEQTLVTLGTVMAKTEEVADVSERVRTATLIMTDGQATDKNASVLKAEVASVVKDMRRVGDHIVAGMGFTIVKDDHAVYDVFEEMGIKAEYIFPARDREQVLRAFRIFGESAIAELTAGRSNVRRVFEG
ncbi:MAG: hypothetical protein LC776_01585 [Acidobacteria bacterium]|nr:hypothetical protein [Acidobacteriota bacterium]